MTYLLGRITDDDSDRGLIDYERYSLSAQRVVERYNDLE